jgi:hypothetical protein
MAQNNFTQLHLFNEHNDEEYFPSGSWLRNYVREAQLDQFTDSFEIWEIEESSAELNTLTHGIFRYFGKFPPPVAKRFIEELHNPEFGPIVDPMVGSGTTLVEAILQKRNAIGLDVNPLSTLVSRVKTTPVEINGIKRTLASFSNFWKSRPSIDVTAYVPMDRYRDHWFYPEIQYEIGLTRYFIDNYIDDEKLRNLFLVALAANIRRFSRASNGLGRMFLDPDKPRLDVYEYVRKQILKFEPMIRELSLLEPHVEVIQKDVRQPFLKANLTNFVIIHPPYFNLYKYSSIYKYEMLWLGFDNAATRKKEITEGFKVGRKELVYDYVEDISEIFKNISMVLRPHGWCVLMIGDTFLRDERINTTSLAIEKILEHNFKVSKIVVRIPKYTEASYAATQRRDGNNIGIKLADYLILFQK